MTSEIENNELDIVIIDSSVTTFEEVSPDLKRDDVVQTNKQLDEINSSITTLSSIISSMQKELQDKINAISAKDDILSNIHNELQDYKSNFYKKIYTPLINHIIQLADNIRIIANHHKPSELNEDILDDFKRLQREFNSIPNQIDDLLGYFFIEPFQTPTGDAFNLEIHSIGGIIPTENTNEDKKIVRSISSGYFWIENGGKQLYRREKVEIYKLKNE